MKETIGLRTANLAVFVTSLLGGVGLAVLGLTRGQCISNCDASDASYVYNPLTVAAGLGVILISWLVYEIVKVFAYHVENSKS